MEKIAQAHLYGVNSELSIRCLEFEQGIAKMNIEDVQVPILLTRTTAVHARHDVAKITKIFDTCHDNVPIAAIAR